MPRPSLISDEDLMRRLSCIFRDVGYSGASLAMLAEAAGLSKASLYHRFPGGKEQMAREVLDYTGGQFVEHVLSPLETDAAPQDKAKALSLKLDAFYESGLRACLLNMLSSPLSGEGPFSQQIKAMLIMLIDALSAVAMEAGASAEIARRRAERVVMLLQGSLVLSRGLGDAAPFRSCLETLENDLFGTPIGDLS